MKYDFSVNNQEGIHSVKKGKERVAVGSLWSIEVSAGYSYCVDTTKTATDINDVHYLLQIQKTDDCDFNDGYSSEVSVTVRDVLYFLDSYHEDARKQMNQFDQIAQQLSIAMGGYELIRSEKDILIGRAEDTLFSYSFMYFILTGGSNSMLTLQITFATDTPSDEAEKIAGKLIDSIEPILVEDYADSLDQVNLGKSYIPDFDNIKYVTVDGSFKVPVPNGFKTKQSDEEQAKLIIAPKDFDFTGDLNEARLALMIQQEVFDFTGKGLDSMEMISLTIKSIHDQLPVQWFNGGVFTDRCTSNLLVVNSYITNNACDKNLNALLICAGEKVYFGYVIINYDSNISDDAKTIRDAKIITSSWLSRILDKGEKTAKKPAADRGQDYSITVPNKSLYPHYDHMMNAALKGAALSMPGVSVVVNQSGTEYEFCSLRSILDTADEELDDADKALMKRIVEQDATNYDLDKKAIDMAGLFRVDKDVFDARNDREAEIINGYIKKSYMFSALRSFAWTLADYCDKNNKQPYYVELDVLKEMIEFIAKRKWLNYDDKSYCKGLCSGSDLHVYYVPDAIVEEVGEKLQISKEDYSCAEQIRSNLPSDNVILKSVQSLDTLREAIQYIYPTIETLYKDLAKNRDTSKPLEGNETDIVYAWCSLAKAAKEPFFSEDGPMTCFFEQQDTEVDPSALEGSDEVKMFVILSNDKKMGKDNRKPNDFFKEYGGDFPALKKKELFALRETVLSEMMDEDYVKRCREAFMKNSVENRFMVATKTCFNVTEIGDFLQKADAAIEKTKDWYSESETTEVRVLMNAELDRIKDKIDKQIKAVDPEWVEWSKAKQHLKVFVRQKNDPQVELVDDCKLFQVERRETALTLDDPKIVIEVLLCKDELHQINVEDGMPLYWGVSYIDVWKAARKNEIVDIVNCMGDLQAKDAMSKIRKKYPDAALIKQRQNAAEREIADAAATHSLLTESDTLCLYAIADYEKNCGRRLLLEGIQNYYKKENNCFRKMKRKQIEQAFRDMENLVAEGGAKIEEYESGFRALPVDERFRYITQPVFEDCFHYEVAQPDKDLIKALDLTGKWYDPCELVYVERKLYFLLHECGIEMDRYYDENGYAYMKDYASLKKNLIIGLDNHTFNKDDFVVCDDGEYRCEVRIKPALGNIIPGFHVGALPWYWGVSKAEVWNNAFRNGDVFISWISSLDETIIKNPARARQIAEKYVKIASQDTHVPDNIYDRNEIYVEIEPYEMVVEKVNNEYGQLTPENVRLYLNARNDNARSEIERKAKEERIERIKKQAHGFEKNGTVNGFYKALELYRGIENDTDVKQEIQTCEERIREAKKELEKQKHYSEGKKLEEKETVSSIKKAAEQYELAEDYKDAANRAMRCWNRAQKLEDESLQELTELQKTLSKLKAQHANLGGLFKKKQRLEVEESIRFCEQKIKETKAILEE